MDAQEHRSHGFSDRDVFVVRVRRYHSPDQVAGGGLLIELERPSEPGVRRFTDPDGALACLRGHFEAIAAEDLPDRPFRLLM